MAKRRTIGIVGAGPAGIMAALQAAQQGAQVHLFDTNPLVGRKLLVTGNGRCNISNLHAAVTSYACDAPERLEPLLARFGPAKLLAYLETLGIPTYATPDGWCYPLSDSAATVADALAAALDLAGVAVHLQTKISDVHRQHEGLVLFVGGPDHTVFVDRLVVATGGKAYPALGSKGEFFPILERLGHQVLPVYPALAPILADVRRFHKLQGVRLDVGASLYLGDRLLGQTVGNIMFTQMGFSGPAAMDLSHWVSRHQDEPLKLCLDLLALHHEALDRLIQSMRDKPLPLAVALGAVLPAKLPPVLLELVGLRFDARLSDVADADLSRLWDLMRHLEAEVTGTRGFKFCQLSTGGVPLSEIDGETMRSQLVPELYLAGEVLDVVGPCGGYNLQFALASGALAGLSAAITQS